MKTALLFGAAAAANAALQANVASISETISLGEVLSVNVELTNDGSEDVEVDAVFDSGAFSKWWFLPEGLFRDTDYESYWNYYLPGGGIFRDLPWEPFLPGGGIFREFWFLPGGGVFRSEISHPSPYMPAGLFRDFEPGMEATWFLPGGGVFRSIQFHQPIFPWMPENALVNERNESSGSWPYLPGGGVWRTTEDYAPWAPYLPGGGIFRADDDFWYLYLPGGGVFRGNGTDWEPYLPGGGLFRSNENCTSCPFLPGGGIFRGTQEEAQQLAASTSMPQQASSDDSTPTRRTLKEKLAARTRKERKLQGWGGWGGVWRSTEGTAETMSSGSFVPFGLFRDATESAQTSVFLPTGLFRDEPYLPAGLFRGVAASDPETMPAFLPMGLFRDGDDDPAPYLPAGLFREGEDDYEPFLPIGLFRDGEDAETYTPFLPGTGLFRNYTGPYLPGGGVWRDSGLPLFLPGGGIFRSSDGSIYTPFLPGTGLFRTEAQRKAHNASFPLLGDSTDADVRAALTGLQQELEMLSSSAIADWISVVGAKTVTVPAGGSVTMSLAATGEAHGQFSAKLLLKKGEATELAIPVELSVTGFPTLTSAIPAEVDLAGTPVGFPTSVGEISLENAGDATLAVEVAGLSGSAAEFEVLPPVGMVAVVKPGSRTSLRLRCTPSSAGPRDAVLTLKTSEEGDGVGATLGKTHEVTVKCEGAAFKLEPDVLAAKAQPEDPAELEAKVTNLKTSGNIQFRAQLIDDALATEAITGYEVVRDAPFVWLDAAAKGLHLSARQSAQTVDLPFTLRVFDKTATAVEVHGDGMVRLVGSGESLAEIKAYHSRYSPRRAGTQVSYQVRQHSVTVQWTGLRFNWERTNRVTFQVVLEESGAIRFFYKDMSAIEEARNSRWITAEVSVSQGTHTMSLDVSQDFPVSGSAVVLRPLYAEGVASASLAEADLAGVVGPVNPEQGLVEEGTAASADCPICLFLPGGGLWRENGTLPFIPGAGLFRDENGSEPFLPGGGLFRDAGRRLQESTTTTTTTTSTVYLPGGGVWRDETTTTTTTTTTSTVYLPGGGVWRNYTGPYLPGGGVWRNASYPFIPGAGLFRNDSYEPYLPGGGVWRSEDDGFYLYLPGGGVFRSSPASGEGYVPVDDESATAEVSPYNFLPAGLFRDENGTEWFLPGGGLFRSTSFDVHHGVVRSTFFNGETYRAGRRLQESTTTTTTTTTSTVYLPGGGVWRDETTTTTTTTTTSTVYLPGGGVWRGQTYEGLFRSPSETYEGSFRTAINDDNSDLSSLRGFALSELDARDGYLPAGLFREDNDDQGAFLPIGLFRSNDSFIPYGLFRSEAGVFLPIGLFRDATGEFIPVGLFRGEEMTTSWPYLPSGLFRTSSTDGLPEAFLPAGLFRTSTQSEATGPFIPAGLFRSEPTESFYPYMPAGLFRTEELAAQPFLPMGLFRTEGDFFYPYIPVGLFRDDQTATDMTPFIPIGLFRQETEQSYVLPFLPTGLFRGEEGSATAYDLPFIPGTGLFRGADLMEGVEGVRVIKGQAIVREGQQLRGRVVVETDEDAAVSSTVELMIDAFTPPEAPTSPPAETTAAPPATTAAPGSDDGSVVPDSDLLQFERLPGHALRGHNDEEVSATGGVEACASACLDREWCLSFDYEVLSHVCKLSRANRLTNAADIVEPGHGWVDYYERYYETRRLSAVAEPYPAQ